MCLLNKNKDLDVKLYAQCVKLCLKKNLCFVFLL